MARKRDVVIGMDPYWLREIFQADDAARADFETFQWQRRSSLPMMSEPQAPSMTPEQVRAEIAAALKAQPAFTTVQRKALVYVFKRIDNEFKRINTEAQKVRDEFNAALADLRADVSGVSKGEVRLLRRGKPDVA